MNRKMYTINVATNARKGPSTKSDIITTVMPGTVLDVIDETYYDHEGNVLEEPWYLTKYGWMCDIYGNTITGDTLGNCFLEVDTDKFDYKFSVLADPYYQKGKTIHQMTYFKDTEAVKDGYKLATITNGALYYEYDGKYYSNGLEVSTGTNNQDVTMTAVSDYLNCGAIYSTGTFNGLPVNIGRYESWMNSLVPQTIDNALSGCLIRLGGQTVYDNKDTYFVKQLRQTVENLEYKIQEKKNGLI